MDQERTLRARKRTRTRRAIVDAAVGLFDRQGYEKTTVADIAAAADIGTRTFFSYFASKEEVLFPDSEDRAANTIAVITDRRGDESPADVLLRAFREVNETDPDMHSGLAELRNRLITTVPAIRGRALQIQFDSQRAIAQSLHAAYPKELDQVEAAALVGSLVGAISGALHQLLDGNASADPKKLGRKVWNATNAALDAWSGSS